MPGGRRARRTGRSEPAAAGSASRRALAAACIGNVVEWYDFAIYGAFASVIAVTYFPSANPVAGLSASFAVFATAFLARPVGAVLFGRLGDRLGRRQVLASVIVLMAVATAGIGLVPGRGSIGALAPLLLIGLRTTQGLSAGGEAAGATTYVVEYAPEGRRAGTAPGCGRRWRSAWRAASARPPLPPGCSRGRCWRTEVGAWPS
jgi:MFS transporter, MHS family, proline/betaine transporter